MAQPFIIVIELVFLALVTLPIEANEGVEERLNVSLSRNEGRVVSCSTEVKEGWGEGLLPFISRSPCIYGLGSHEHSIQGCLGA